MAYLKIENVKIAGIAAGVPKRRIDNLNAKERISEEYDNKRFVEETGVSERRIDEKLTTSDLFFPAARKLLSDLGWEAKDINAIIVVTQFPDFIAPATACIVQDRLGCSKECMSFDIELGCSGWVYGMSVITSLMQNGNIKKALLLAGDGRWNYKGAEKYSDALFGHAATATALEYYENADPMYFHLGTDGSGYRSLWVPEGGARYPFTSTTLTERPDDNGNMVTGITSIMNGMDVFSFGISTAPKSIKRLCEHFNLDYNNADYYVFHQANFMMNKMIAKKLNLDKTKIPYSLHRFGNTSSATIPLTMVSELAHNLTSEHCRLICCGFGIGLSWGTAYITTDRITVSKLVEVDSDEHML